MSVPTLSDGNEAPEKDGVYNDDILRKESSLLSLSALK